ncbi:hypothetical protein ACOMHN_063005 [Nucella lapillus]
MFLPFPTTLPDGKGVIVNRVTDHQVSEMYDMIQDSAMKGEGYGVDEFPSEKDFVKEVHNANGKIFHVSDRESGATLAAFVILDSKYFRGQNTVADCYMVVQREQRRKGLGEFCMKMVLEFARRMGYSGIYSDTFNDNIAMRKIIEQAGFQKVGVLPMSARMPDGSVKPSVIYYRELPAGLASTHQGQIGDRSNANLQEGDSMCVESDTMPT